MGLLVVSSLCGVAPAAALDARDSLDPPPARDADAAAAVARFAYDPAAFTVRNDDRAGGLFDAAVRFPSPRPVGDEAIDTVVMDWRKARGEGGQLRDGPAPAVIVIHSVQPQLVVGRSLAYQLANRGVHAFVLHLPGYGGRLPAGERWTPVRAIERGPQGVADARRAYDAVAALPGVDGDRVSLVGVSLGGFVAALTTSVDPEPWRRVWLIASGADIEGALTDGERDAARVARWLAAAGYTGDRLEALLADIEPAPLLHRLDAADTHLVRPTADRVIPPASYDTLIDAAGLPPTNVHEIEANHYTLMLALPRLVGMVVEGES